MWLIAYHRWMKYVRTWLSKVPEPRPITKWCLVWHVSAMKSCQTTKRWEMFRYSFGSDGAYAWTQHITLIMISAQVCAWCLAWNNKRKHEGNHNNQTRSLSFRSCCWIMWTWLDTPWSLTDPGFCSVSGNLPQSEVLSWALESESVKKSGPRKMQDEK